MTGTRSAAPRIPVFDPINGGLTGQSAPPAAPVRRARNPQTGEVLVLRNGRWEAE